MESIPFALSVTHFVDSVGAKAGFAAIIGLAILVLLFFAQAHETSNLRKRAAESDEHVQQLELRVAQLTRASAGTAPVAPAPAGVHRPSVAPPPPGVASAAAAAAPGLVAARAAHAPAATPVPAAPAGVGAPAMSSATRLIPAGDDGPISIRATGPAVAAGAAAGVIAAEAEADDQAEAGVASPPGPAPATAAGGANGGVNNRVPAPAAAPTPPPSIMSPQQAVRPPARPAATRPGGAPPVRPGDQGGGPSRVRPIALAVAGAIAVAAIVVVLLVLTSQNSNPSNANSGSNVASTHDGRHHRVHGALKPSDVTVAVLNGTTTPFLAHDTSVRLSAFGYKRGTVATATDQSQSATVVAYRPGHKADALLVAKSLKLGPASVQPVAQANEAVACPQASACTAQVVVNVGADLASTAITTTSAAST